LRQQGNWHSLVVHPSAWLIYRLVAHALRKIVQHQEPYERKQPPDAAAEDIRNRDPTVASRLQDVTCTCGNNWVLQLSLPCCHRHECYELFTCMCHRLEASRSAHASWLRPAFSSLPCSSEPDPLSIGTAFFLYRNDTRGSAASRSVDRAMQASGASIGHS
jgi:hypothetical protein